MMREIIMAKTGRKMEIREDKINTGEERRQERENKKPENKEEIKKMYCNGKKVVTRRLIK